MVSGLMVHKPVAPTTRSIALTVLVMTMVIPGLLLPWLMKQLDLTAY